MSSKNEAQCTVLYSVKGLHTCVRELSKDTAAILQLAANEGYVYPSEQGTGGPPILENSMLGVHSDA